MKTTNLFRLLFGTMLLFVATAMTACTDNDDEQNVTIPTLEVSTSSLTFDVDGGTQSFDIKTNGEWSVTGGEDSAWLGISPAREGSGNATISVSVSEATVAREAQLTVTVYSTILGIKKAADKKTVKVTQVPGGTVVTGETLYFDDFDGQLATNTWGNEGKSWPYIDQFPQFANPTGTAAAGVTYSGTGMSVRANSTSNSSYSNVAAEASGNNNIFFGANAAFVGGPLKLGADDKNLKLTFLSEKYLQSGDSNFNPSEFAVYLSKDSVVWANVPYIYADGATDDVISGKWNKAVADFTLSEVPEKLYIKFTASVASAYRLDDVKLVNGIGGATIDLSKGSSSGGSDVDQSDVKAVTIAEFLAAPESDTIYELTGTVSGSINTTYGNFDLVDETGSVYVYGLSSTPQTKGTSADKTFSSMGITAGAKIKIRGYRTVYGEKDEVQSAWLVEILEKGDGGNGGNGGGTDVPTSGAYTSDAAFVCSADDSNVSIYTLGTSTTFNGGVATGVKFGTGSYTGVFTSAAVGVTGTQTLSFYGVAWKGKSATIYVKVNGGGTISGANSAALKANDGANNNPPFTITVTNSDFYSFNIEGLTASSTITISTSANFDRAADAASGRAVLARIRLTEGANSAKPEDGSGSTDPDPGTDPNPNPGEAVTATVAQFLAAAESNTVYELTGTVANIVNTTYGNFDLKDDTGSVYVYGLSTGEQAKGASTDKSFPSMGITAGDKIKIRGYRTSYNGTPQVGSAWLVEILEKGTVTPPEPATGNFASDAAFVCSADDSGTSTYSLKDSTFNGEAATGVKLGTASKIGTFTSAAVGVTGDKTLTFYGVAWKGDKATIYVTVEGGGSVSGDNTAVLAANAGATGNAPFTVTGVSDSDKYSIKLTGLTASSKIVLKTDASTGYRAVLAGIHLE